MKYQEDKQDVHPGLAVAGLVLLVGAWIYFQAPNEFMAMMTELDAYAERNLTALICLLFASTINVVWISSIIARTFGINRQGKRLEILTQGKGRKGGEKPKPAPVSMAVGCVSVPLLFAALQWAPRDWLPSFVSVAWTRGIWAVVSFDLGLAVFVVLSVFEKAGVFSRLGNAKAGQLPEFPHPKNALVLGAVEDLQ